MEKELSKLNTIKELVSQWRKTANDKFMTDMIDYWSNEDRKFYNECCDKMKAIEKQLIEEYDVKITKAFFDDDTQFKYNEEVI